MYFWCFGFRGELGFLNCDDVCMCVVNKQFELLEFVSESVYVDLRSSRALIFSNISAGTDSVLIRCRPEDICCDAAFIIMVRKIFSAFWQFV